MGYRRVELERITLAARSEGCLSVTFPGRIEFYALAIHPDDTADLYVERIRLGGACLIGGEADTYADDTIRRPRSVSFSAGGVELPAHPPAVHLTLEAGFALRVDLRNLAVIERAVRSAVYVLEAAS